MSELPTHVRSGLIGRRSILIGVAVVLTAVTFLVYLPTLQNAFVFWDDPEYVLNNIPIRTLDIAFLKWASTAVVVSNWHPITLFSHALDYFFWELNPWGHHLTSIVLHSLNTALFFFLSIRLIECGSRGRHGFMSYTLINPAVLFAAATAALLFGIHPVHVESVSWVSERKDLLSAFFFILCIYFYLGYAAAIGGKKAVVRRRYVIALLTFILSLMSKPMAVSLPVVLLLLDFYPLERFPGAHGWVAGLRRILPEKVPFIFLSGLSSIITLWAQKSGGAVESLTVIPLSVRIPAAFHSYLFYIYKLVAPKDLAPIYIHPFKIDLLSVEYIVPVLLFSVITFVSILLVKRRKIFIVVWCYYLITLLPVIGLIQVGSQVAADRYTYLPGLGPTLLTAVGLGLFFERCRRKVLRNAVVSVIIVLLFLFGLLTLKQESVWRDTVSLWSRQVALYPSPMSYTSRAEAYRKEGNYSSAVTDYSRALELGRKTAGPTIDPGVVYINRGNAYSELGDIDAALKDYSSAININPYSFLALINRGNLYRKAGMYALAVQDFRAAIAANPSASSLYVNLGVSYAGAGNRAAAYSALKRAERMGVTNAGSIIEALGLTP